MENPRSHPSTRITDLFPFPAQGYDAEAYWAEYPHDLRGLGLYSEASENRPPVDDAALDAEVKTR